jgi:hypothetical protein
VSALGPAVRWSKRPTIQTDDAMNSESADPGGAPEVRTPALQVWVNEVLAEAEREAEVPAPGAAVDQPPAPGAGTPSPAPPK